MPEKLTVENYVEHEGEIVPMDSLPEETAAQISLLLQDAFMEALGYCRKKEP